MREVHTLPMGLFRCQPHAKGLLRTYAVWMLPAGVGAHHAQHLLITGILYATNADPARGPVTLSVRGSAVCAGRGQRARASCPLQQVSRRQSSGLHARNTTGLACPASVCASIARPAGLTRHTSAEQSLLAEASMVPLWLNCTCHTSSRCFSSTCARAAGGAGMTQARPTRGHGMGRRLPPHPAPWQWQATLHPSCMQVSSDRCDW